MAFTADTSQAKAQIKSLQTLLNELTAGNLGKNYGDLGLTKEISGAISKANELKSILAKSTKADGSFDLKRFSLSLLEGKTDLNSFAKELDKLGPKGTEAFNQLAKTVSSSTVQFDKARGVLNEMWATMKNTARWQLTSSVLHDFIGGLQSAYGYAQKLNKSLTDIRIVSGESAESMADFADRANKAAKELGSTTLKYSDASLIYFQQGK